MRHHIQKWAKSSWPEFDFISLNEYVKSIQSSHIKIVLRMFTVGQVKLAQFSMEEM